MSKTSASRLFNLHPFPAQKKKNKPKRTTKNLVSGEILEQGFFNKKREEKPKRNLKKGLTKSKTRHQRSVKKRKRDLKSEQKKRGARKDCPKKE
ncbi:hypothetical protein [Blautia massiliensis (ex Durand et al. 2017)]|uniref:hypothetical protein n=1 Tax=Blautia massiliensis (ex Durand et al. 2017) TaxID=1737424 RepID=UPI0022E906DD|nr:hypothetical protein [Blautia massiliensis (ex Durand et al. 2017)]